MASKAPCLWVIAGPNGAGKSSLVGARFSKSLPIVNPDDIARDLADRDNGAAEAGRMAVAERRRLMDAGVSFGIESTLSGVGVLRFMARARDTGYRLIDRDANRFGPPPDRPSPIASSEVFR